LAGPGEVPDWRLQPAQRPADAAQQAAHRPVRRPRLLHHRLARSMASAGKEGRDSMTAVEQATGQALDWEYAPAPQARDIVSIAPENGLFINGEFVPAADGRQ